VLSGVNRGHNVAEDVVYSGTVGGAMEAAMNGARAVALSQFYTRGADAPEDLFASARAHGAAALRHVLAMPAEPFLFYNVNFPALGAERVRGFTVCPHGLRAEATFEIVPVTAPNGRDYQFYRHNTANASAAEGTDARLLIEGWITITPLRPQITATDVLEEARAALGRRVAGEEG
jgi:5'-nucleotidase